MRLVNDRLLIVGRPKYHLWRISMTARAIEPFAIATHVAIRSWHGHRSALQDRKPWPIPAIRCKTDRLVDQGAIVLRQPCFRIGKGA